MTRIGSGGKRKLDQKSEKGPCTLGRASGRINEKLDPSEGKIEITKEAAASAFREKALRPLPNTMRPDDIPREVWQVLNQLRIDRIKKEIDRNACVAESAELARRRDQVVQHA